MRPASSGGPPRWSRAARTATHLEAIIFQIVRYLVAIDVALVAVMFAYAAVVGAKPVATPPPSRSIILIASVPVALPTTFTVAQAVGALELSQGADDRHRGHGVLVTRLSAVQEGASMDVLCTDKTGTLTLNQLTLEDTVAFAALRPRLVVLDLAARPPTSPARTRSTSPCSAPAADDLGTARRGTATGLRPLRPLDQAHRSDRQTAAGSDSGSSRGCPRSWPTCASTRPPTLAAEVDRLAATGARVLAVAVGPRGGAAHGRAGRARRPAPTRFGRSSSASSSELGIDVKMVTGDTPATAVSVAPQVGIEPTRVHRRRAARATRSWPKPARCSPAVFPEDKYTLGQDPAGRRSRGRA